MNMRKANSGGSKLIKGACDRIMNLRLNIKTSNDVIQFKVDNIYFAMPRKSRTQNM